MGLKAKKSHYTLKDLSNELQMSVRTLRAHVRKGTLCASKIGRTYWVMAADVDRFLDRGFPMRNYLCTNYNTCLAKAARLNTNFECNNCQKSRMPILGDIFPLREAIFGHIPALQ